MAVHFCSLLCSKLLAPDVWEIDLNEPSGMGLAADTDRDALSIS
jgi:hypothetical protein